MDGIVKSVQSGLSCYPVKKGEDGGKMKHRVLALVVVISVLALLLPTSALGEYVLQEMGSEKLALAL